MPPVSAPMVRWSVTASFEEVPVSVSMRANKGIKWSSSKGSKICLKSNAMSTYAIPAVASSRDNNVVRSFRVSVESKGMTWTSLRRSFWTSKVGMVRRASGESGSFWRRRSSAISSETIFKSSSDMPSRIVFKSSVSSLAVFSSKVASGTISTTTRCVFWRKNFEIKSWKYDDDDDDSDSSAFSSSKGSSNLRASTGSRS
mmetsp:Transcript_23604/g.75761  ORF Transcript_23604/g.75761 Transcript_23604/m.75761 type:complete len:200 (+) Transcript_23604:455-1054(+)